MRICYVDESGHCGTKVNADQPVQVLCGVITDGSKLFKTQKEHTEILDYLKDQGIKVDEIKAAEIYGGRKAWDGIDPKLRDAIYEALIHWSSSRSCKFIVSPVDSAEFFKRKASKCAMAGRFQFPWEAGAFNVALAVQRENRNKKNNKGRTLVIYDEQKKHDERFLRLFEEDLSYTDGYTGYAPRPRAKSPPRFDQIVDVPHFSKSHLTVMIQIADVAAYIVNRHLSITAFGSPEKYTGEADKLERWYKMIGSSMIGHTSIDPPGKDDLCDFFRAIRPSGWSAKAMREN